MSEKAGFECIVMLMENETGYFADMGQQKSHFPQKIFMTLLKIIH